MQTNTIIYKRHIREEKQVDKVLTYLIKLTKPWAKINMLHKKKKKKQEKKKKVFLLIIIFLNFFSN